MGILLCCRGIASTSKFVHTVSMVSKVGRSSIPMADGTCTSAPENRRRQWQYLQRIIFALVPMARSNRYQRVGILGPDRKPSRDNNGSHHCSLSPELNHSADARRLDVSSFFALHTSFSQGKTLLTLCTEVGVDRTLPETNLIVCLL